MLSYFVYILSLYLSPFTLVKKFKTVLLPEYFLTQGCVGLLKYRMSVFLPAQV